MCIFAAEWFSLSVNFFTARDGVVLFSHYFKQFCILVQIATKGPDLLQNRSRKSPDSSWKSFFSPITTYFSTKSRWQNFVAQALDNINYWKRKIYVLQTIGVGRLGHLWVGSTLNSTRCNCGAKQNWDERDRVNCWKEQYSGISDQLSWLKYFFNNILGTGGPRGVIGSAGCRVGHAAWHCD